MTKVFTRRFKVRWSEVGAAKRVPASKYMEYLVETAFDWGSANKLGFEESLALGVAWIILETDIHFLHPLRYADEFGFTIWMLEWRKIRGSRAFELRLKDSETIIAQGVQKIVSLDKDSLRPIAVPDDLINGFRIAEPRSFPTQPFPKLGESPAKAFRMQRNIEWGELDSWVHLNNGEALRYADEVLMQFLASLGWPPERFFAEGMTPVPKRIHVKYQEPGLWADRLNIETYPIDVQANEVSSAIVVEREADARGIVQALYDWGLVDLKTDAERPLPEDLQRALADILESPARMRARHR